MTTPATAPPIDLTLLEPLLRELVDVVGLTGTLAIVEAHGGTRLWVPNDVTPDHPLAKLLGEGPAQRLCLRFGGDRPFIPKARAALQALRDADIRINPEGLSVPQLARKHRLIERRIYQIRGDAAPAAGTPGLFD